MPLNQLIDSGVAITPPPPDVQRTTLGLDLLGRFICNMADRFGQGDRSHRIYGLELGDRRPCQGTVKTS
jgi:hypothetical protein